MPTSVNTTHRHELRALQPASGKWTSPGGGTRVQLWDSAADCGGGRFASFEVGPAVLRPDGSVFATGANACGAAHTAIYNGKLDGPRVRIFPTTWALPMVLPRSNPTARS